MDIESISTPALDAAEAEYEKMITDPTHPHYAGLRRGEATAEAYASNLFKKAAPDNKPVEIGKQESVSDADLSEDVRASIDVDVELRQTFGASYDTVMQEMALGAQYLFAGDDGQHALTVFSDRIAALGPKAEALGVKYLADLSKLQSQGGIQS